MAVSDLIQVNDRIDIRLIKKSEKTDKPSGMVDIYKSKVLAIKKNSNFEIAMPIEKGKLIVLPLGVRFEFVFYSHNGSMYRSIGQVVERYKKDGFYMLEIELKRSLQKVQRREFYRYMCAIDFEFYILNEKQVEMKTVDEVYYDLMEDAVPYHGEMVDLSGGGMKFRSPYVLKPGEKVMVVLKLDANRPEQQYYIFANTIACVEALTPEKIMYESRVKFIIEDDRIREDIIRFIFEEERKNRQKENG